MASFVSEPDPLVWAALAEDSSSAPMDEELVFHVGLHHSLACGQGWLFDPPG